MPEIKLNPQQLEAYLPHRGLNLFIDEVTIAADGQSATSITRVPPGDPRGREFFARQGPDGRPCWYTPFLGELLALTGVTLQKAMLEAGQVAVFSAISKCDFPGLAPLDEPVHGYAELTRVRTGFCQYLAHLECGGKRLFAGEIMSGVSTFKDILDKDTVPLDETPVEAVDPAAFAWKHPALRFIDGVRSFDAVTGRLVGTYTYPTGHPLIPGHFPAGPIMMGVTQWASLADAGYEAMRRLGLERAMVNGNIERANGDPVVSVRDLGLVATDHGCVLAGVKRLLFRGPVTPGDGIIIDVQVSGC